MWGHVAAVGVLLWAVCDFRGKGAELFGADTVLVLCKADWCPHCVGLKKSGEWDKVEKHFANGRTLKTRVLDADANADALQAMGVKGFPTILLYMHGRRYEYSGDRTADGIIKWVASITASSF